MTDSHRGRQMRPSALPQTHSRVVTMVAFFMATCIAYSVYFI